MVERTNRTVMDMLAILAENDPATWDEQLPFVQFALNTTVYQSINTHHSCCLLDTRVILRQVCLNRHTISYGEDYPSEIFTKMKNAWRIAAEASKKARTRYAHYYDKQVQPLRVKEGSLVMRLNESAPANQSRKLAARWRGSYRVIKKLGPVNFIIKGIFEDQVERTIHINKLKLYVAREELELPSVIPVPERVEGMVIPDAQSEEDDDLSSLLSSQVRPGHPTVTRSRAHVSAQ
ncbi:uncharacterized protein [Procambarus clarkii]|uniref:uncharacterized protein n=1 Tax=Procambarus clarkii TaxID=6728 RepID=UPI003743C8C8